MKVPYSWLKDFVDIDVSCEELAEKLVSVGFEVEDVIDLSENIQNVKVGKVVKIVPHENADKLRICSIDVAGDRLLQIVTGAKNVQEGDVVPVCCDGAVLPGGKVIRTGELRGVLSEGMLCSGEELGLTDADIPGASVYGILILPKDAPIGLDFNEYIGNNDIVLDIEVTANRPDCQSVLGMAREVAAVLKKPLKTPAIDFKTSDFSSDIKVENDSLSLCPRYMAARVNNVVIKDSPEYIKRRLRAVGLRPINNIVDITNYVLFEIGQPMHAFDRRLISGDTIVVRNAFDGEKIVTLDGKENVLSSDMLVIADKQKANAVAGIMGGENSGINDDTTSIVFESAKFARDNIRRTSRKLNLRSDSSSRFEKGIDYQSQEIALARALHLICEQNAGEISSEIIDVHQEFESDRVLNTTIEKITSILGIEISEKFVEDTLNYLNIETKVEKGKIICKIPGWRDDISNANDIAEEIIRFYGYDHISATLFDDAEQTIGCKSESQKKRDSLANALNGMGYFENVTYSFTTPKAFDLLNLKADNKLRFAAKLKNALGEDLSVMRTTLAHSMLNTIASNVKKRNLAGKFYEIAKVYLPYELPLERQPKEENHLIVGLFGEDGDFFAIKGVLQNVLALYGIEKTAKLVREDCEYLHPGRSASVYLGDVKLGYLGEIHPDVLNNYEINQRAYIIELNVDLLFEVKDDSFKYQLIPKYPSVERDFAFVMKDETEIGGLIDDIVASVKNVEAINIFDIYRGNQVAQGYKSVAVKIVLRALDHTLTENEIEETKSSVLQLLSEKYNAELRG